MYYIKRKAINTYMEAIEGRSGKNLTYRESARHEHDFLGRGMSLKGKK